jgi:hypothetical protein
MLFELLIAPVVFIINYYFFVVLEFKLRASNCWAGALAFDSCPQTFLLFSYFEDRTHVFAYNWPWTIILLPMHPT